MKYPKGTFTQIQLKAVENLPSKAQLLFVWLNYYADSKGTCFPSLKTLSNKSKMSVPSVIKYIKILSDKGIIQKTKQNKQKSNLYKINVLKGLNTKYSSGLTEVVKEVNTKYSSGLTEVVKEVNTNYNQLTTSNITKSNELAKKQNNDFFKGFTDKGMESVGEIIQKIKEQGMPGYLAKKEIEKFYRYWTKTDNDGLPKWKGRKDFNYRKRLSYWLSKVEFCEE